MKRFPPQAPRALTRGASPSARCALLVFAVVANGCVAAELGLNTGVTGPIRERANFMWGGQLTVEKAPPPGESGVVGGVELGGLTAYGDGARWTVGALLGYGQAPSPRMGALGWELHLDLGTHYRDGALLEDWNMYGGGTASLLLFLSGTRDETALNDNVRALKALPLVVLSLRPRAIRLPDCSGPCWRGALLFQVAFRMALISDYAPF